MLNIKKTSFLLKLKNIAWPIDKSELKLFIPMALMMLCMLFNFGALRSVKDSLVVPNIGPEVISFLKLWLVLPTTIIFTIIYVKLSNMFDFAQRFYLIMAFFLGFFIIFTYILYPNQDFYHPSEANISQIIVNYPNLKWFILIFGKWSYALMYVFSEMWSVVIINLLFWQFANNIFDTKSARRFYPILGAVGNLGLIFAGNLIVKYSDTSNFSDDYIVENYASHIAYQSQTVLQPIMNVIIFAGFIAMILYYYIDNHILTSEDIKKQLSSTKKLTKTKLSVKESIQLLLRSKYIGHIVILILCYGLLINLLEGPWKARVRELYPNTIDYINFMGKFNIWMGVSCVIFMVVGGNILRRFSWLFSALITPFMISCTGIIFFIFVIFANDISFLGENFNPIYAAVIIGAIQNILSKSTKYSLFDSTKEMAYMPLSLELRTKGKAAVEVVGLKFGKSLGAFLQSSMFILMPLATFDSVTIYLMFIFVIVIILWVWNIKVLNKEYSKLQENENTI